MTDIAERLGKHVSSRLPVANEPQVENGAWAMMLEAKEEIIRLRAENNTLREILLHDIIMADALRESEHE